MQEEKYGEKNDYTDDIDSNTILNAIEDCEEDDMCYSDNEDSSANIHTSNTPYISNALRKWVAEFNITLRALRALILIINVAYNDKNLPRDPRTIMRTPRSVMVLKLGNDGAEYWHHGLVTCLSRHFKNLAGNKTIALNVNIDGLPLFNSASKCFWPILVNVDGLAIPPMVVGVYYGEKKPENAEIYFRPFVEECKTLIQDGLTINGNTLRIVFRCFICDSPARAFVKGTMNFNARHGCQRCTVIGKHSGISNTVVFTSVDNELRNDAAFRAKQYPYHQKTDTPLTDLPIDMIKDFVVADPLHLLELGVMKRLIIGWKSGNMTYAKWSDEEVLDISKWLLNIKTPQEIHRDARSLLLFRLWKGQEF